MRTLYFILLFINTLAVLGQEKEFYIHTNKPIYLSGETIYFNLYYYDTNYEILSSDNETLTCYLVNSENEQVNKIKISLFGGTASGYFELDKDLTDGFYYIVVYNQNNHYAKEIPIYKAENKKRISEEFINVSLDEIYNTSVLTLQTDKDNYSPREAIKVNIEARNESDEPVFTTFSVSFGKYIQNKRNTDSFKMSSFEGGLNFSNDLKGIVKRIELKEFNKLNEIVKKSQEIGDNEKAEQLISYMDRFGNGVVTNALVVGYAINNKKMMAAYCDDMGNITFSLDEMTGQDNIYMIAYDSKGKRIGEVYVESLREADPKDFLQNISVKKESPLRSPLVERYIENHLKVNKIKKAYYPDSNEEQFSYTREFKGDFNVSLEEFSTMASVKDAVREITPRAVIKTNKRKKIDEIYLIEWGGGRFKETPLYFIDGIPTLNTDTVLNLDYRNCKTFSVVTKSENLRQFWQMGQNGIFSINLKKGTENPVKARISQFTRISSIQQPHSVNAISWEVEKRQSTDKPNLGTTFFWNPNLFTRDGSLDFKIAAPDNLGTFSIELFGVNEDGEIQVIRKNINIVLAN